MTAYNGNTLLARKAGLTKPNGPLKLNYNHAMSNYLAGFFVEQSGIMVNLVEPSQQSFPIGGASYPLRGHSQYGTTLQFNDTHSLYFNPNLRQKNTTFNHAFGVGYVRTAAFGPDSNYCSFGRTANNGASAPFQDWRFRHQVDATTPGAMATSYSTNASGSTGTELETLFTITDTIGTMTHLASSFYWNGSLSKIVEYWNGAVVATDARDTGDGTQVDTNASICFGGTADAFVDHPFPGLIYYGWVAYAAIPDNLIAEFHRNPWDIVRPATRILYFDAVPVAIHDIDVISSEFDFQASSGSLAQFLASGGNDFAYETGTTTLTQKHIVGVQSSDFGWEAISAPLNFLVVNSAEFDFEAKSVAVTVQTILFTSKNFFRWEASPPSLNTYGVGSTPSIRVWHVQNDGRVWNLKRVR